MTLLICYLYIAKRIVLGIIDLIEADHTEKMKFTK